MADLSAAPEPRRRKRGRPGGDTRLTLILTAEALFARRGPHGVSLREVSAAAGQRNNSAVQYHFGSKPDLIRAIFRHRLPTINGRRLELVRSLESDTVRDLIRAELTPYVELAEQPDVHYVEFVARMFLDRQFAIMFERVEEPELVEGQLEIRRRLARLLRPSLPPGLVDHRLWMATTQILYGLAERRRIAETLGPAWTIPLPTWIESYVDYAAGALTSPASPEAARRGQFRLGRIGASIS